MIQSRPAFPIRKFARARLAIIILAIAGPSLAAAGTGQRALLAPADVQSLQAAVLRPAVSEWVGGIAVMFQRTPAQQRELEALLAAQHEPRSAEYRRWLTPEAFGQRFGTSATIVAETAAWLRQAGLQVDSVDPSGAYVLVSGSVATVERAFTTRLRRVEPVDGRRPAYVNVEAIHVPDHLADAIATTYGLSGIVPRPAHSHREVAAASAVPLAAPQPAYTTGTQHFIAPADLHAIYNYAPLFATGRGAGAGIHIAVLGQSEVLDSDLDAFRRASGLPATSINRVLVPNTGTATRKPGDERESDLDLEWAGASAPEATLDFVYVGNASGSNVFTALQYAVSRNIAPIITLSYGVCEAQTNSSFARSLRSTIQQANAQGQTVFTSSGDSGAAACDRQGALAATAGPAVNLPADIPEVTAVGGTQFHVASGSGSTAWSSDNSPVGGSATGYLPEIAWNLYVAPNSSSPATGSLIVMASGGGASSYFSKPAWQAGTGVPADGRRDVPDVSINADGIYLICSSDGMDNPCTNGYASAQGQLSMMGGTSVSAPVWAGLAADIESLGGGARLGNMNPALYGILNDAGTYTSAFHDVSLGDNSVPCVAVLSNGCPLSLFYQGDRATAGYDAVTGIGTPDAYALATRLAPPTLDTTSVPAPTPTGNPAPSPASNPPATPAPSASASGGAGSPVVLMGLALAALSRRRRSRPRKHTSP